MSILFVRKNLSKAMAGAALASFSSIVGMPGIAQAYTIKLYTEQTQWEKDLKAQPVQKETFDTPNLQPGIRVTSTVGKIQQGLWNDRVSNSPVETTEWNFAKPIVAWGGKFDLGPSDPGQGVAVVVSKMLSNSQKVGEIPNTYAGKFWGFLAEDPDFDTVTLKAGTQKGYRESYTMDDLVYAEPVSKPPTNGALTVNAQPVPEPTTILGSLAFASFLVVLSRRRQQLQQVSKGSPI